jgi:hypothetical protein
MSPSAIRRWSALALAVAVTAAPIGITRAADQKTPATPPVEQKEAESQKKSEEKKPEEKKSDAKKTAGPSEAMDYGPFLNLALNAKGAGDNNTYKAIAIPLGTNDKGQPSHAGNNETPPASVCFDADLLRYSAGWTNGFQDYAGVTFKGDHGRNPAIRGDQKWYTKKAPGWANPADGSWKDPRTDVSGPLPAEWAKFRGIHRHGNTVVLSYTVGKTQVLEMPGVTGSGDTLAFTRAFTVGPSERPLVLNVANRAKPFSGTAEGAIVTLEDGATTVAVAAPNAPAGARLKAEGDGITLELPPLANGASFSLLIWSGPADGVTQFAQRLPKIEAVDLTTYTKGGPGIWPQTVETKFVRGKDDPAYTLDTYEAPTRNPWNSIIRFGGFDFLPDGKSAVLSTWSGDVWHVSDISGTPDKLTWRRIASGLFEPLGLKVRDGEIFVHCRDGIWRLKDLNGDQEIDLYEVFNNDVHNNPFFHEFAFDLQMDKDGNFYFAKAGPVNPGGSGFQKPWSQHNGTLMKLSKDGKYLEVIATGLRAPNGIGINPETGQLTAGDNEGTWVPKSPLHWVTPGYFAGVVDLAGRPMKSNKKTPDLAERPNPICWFPKNVDNSGGGQTWVPSDNDKWGPFKGNLLHTSYGTCNLYNVMYEFVGGEEGKGGTIQGGVTKFPLKFDSGICRPRFSPFDGQLYIAGLTGWQSSGAKSACFQRVRYTGKPVTMANGLKVQKDGLQVTFTSPLDPATATDAGNWSVEQWNYEWAEHYGSSNYSVADPKKKGSDNVKDAVEVKSVKLSPDGKTATIELADGVVPVMQMNIKYNVKAADGTPVKSEIYNTINRVPGSSAVANNGSTVAPAAQ